VFEAIIWQENLNMIFSDKGVLQKTESSMITLNTLEKQEVLASCF